MFGGYSIIRPGLFGATQRANTGYLSVRGCQAGNNHGLFEWVFRSISCRFCRTWRTKFIGGKILAKLAGRTRSKRVPSSTLKWQNFCVESRSKWVQSQKNGLQQVPLSKDCSLITSAFNKHRVWNEFHLLPRTSTWLDLAQAGCSFQSAVQESVSLPQAAGGLDAH